jgi:hypothetical protein
LAAVVVLQCHGKVDLALLPPRRLHHEKHARHVRARGRAPKEEEKRRSEHGEEGSGQYAQKAKSEEDHRALLLQLFELFSILVKRKLKKKCPPTTTDRLQIRRNQKEIIDKLPDKILINSFYYLF